MQSQTAVIAHLKSEQLLLFAFPGQLSDVDVTPFVVQWFVIFTL